MSTIYKNKQVKKALMKLYEEKLDSLDIECTEIDVDTQFGRTRVIKTGNLEGKKIVLFHGYNAGALVTLEAVKELGSIFCLYAIDTIGQATKSDETKMNIKDDSFALWSDEVLEKLNIKTCSIIGISYGAFILQKLITYKPQRVETCIFVVPSGIVKGEIWESITKLTMPLIRYKITKKEKHLKAFLDAFVPIEDKFMFKMLKLILEGVKLDTRIPTLLKRKNIAHFNNPVYIIAASDDVYFPGKKIAEKSKFLFNNLKEVHLLKNSKHMPSQKMFGDIQSKIIEWMN